MNPLDTEHDCEITTRSMLESMEQIATALRNVKKARKNARQWKKALAEGKVTIEACTAAIKKAEALMTHSFAVACEHGMACGQGDEMGWDERAAAHAADIIAAK